VNKNINRLINNFWNKIVDNLSVEEKEKTVKFNLPLEKCRICTVSNAKWFNTVLKEYACDTCVPRGCSCRLKRISNRTKLVIQDYEYMLDKNGRELPCEDWVKF